MLSPPNDLSSEDLRSGILRMAEVALYIQEIGAGNLVHYYPTAHGTYGHVEASCLGRPNHWDAAWDAVEKSILAEASFSIRKVGERSFSVRIEASADEVSPIVEIQLEKDEPADEDYLRSRATRTVAPDYMEALESDLKLANVLKGPLASTLWSHQRAIAALGEMPDPSSIAFNVSFPTLENVPIKELIAIRSANGDAFHAFRDAIAKAAREMCAVSREPSYDSLAKQIKSQVIDPEITRLNIRLKTAKASLARKAAGTITLSTVGTLCAASLGIVPAATAGVVVAAAAIGNLTKDLSKFIDDRDAVRLSDMYFIWKALKHAE